MTTTTTEADQKTTRNRAQTKFDALEQDILNSQQSLVAILVKGFRQDAIAEKLANKTFAALQGIVADAVATYSAAIAQPEPKIRTTSRINLLEN